jgi:hypothetical protein
MQTKKSIFPDSSVFFHFSPLNEMDLPHLFDCSEVEVMFTLIVAEELIRHQSEHHAPEKQHPEETIKQVEKWLDGQQSMGSGVAANFLARRPDNETMKKNGLNWQHENESLLGVIIEYKQTYSDETVILLTGDSDLAVQARTLGIEAVVLSSKYNLTETKNTLQVRKQKLRQQLAGLRYRTSSLSLSFVGGQDKIRVTLAPQLDSLTEAMQAQLVAVADNLRRETAQHKTEEIAQAMLDDLEALAALGVQQSMTGGHAFLGKIAEEEAKRYRREIEAYPKLFERYLGRCLEMINEHRRTIRLDLEIENKGGAQAEKVLLVLVIPEQLEWHWRPSESGMPAPPAPPSPPGQEGQLLEKSFHIGRVSSVPSSLLNRDYISSEEPTGASPVISKTGTKLQWELGAYHHNQSRLLEPLYIRFKHADEITNFAITWETQERNRSGPVRGELLVFVDTMLSTEKGNI